MAKGYMVAQIDVHDMESYGEYAAKVPATLVPYEGRFLVRGGKAVPLEGDPPPQRTVVSEFPSLAHARAWYESDAYQALIPLRQAAGVTRNYLVEGPDD